MSSVDEHIDRSLNSLKDFQRATVDVVYNQLFQNGQRRMLVADEVGLGKTIVAKGVIARRIASNIESGDSSPLKVTYICSNQVIAHENVAKLDIYPGRRSHDRFASRLTYLALAPESEDEHPLRLNTLTPATSFNKGSSTGQQNERLILYSLLTKDPLFRRRRKAVSVMLRAGVRRAPRHWFEDLERQRRKPLDRALRPCSYPRFIKEIKSRRLRCGDSPLFEYLGTSTSISLYEAVADLTSELTLKNFRQYRDVSDQLVRELKNSLSEVCIAYIDADIYVLDEFQRFKDLVDRESKSEAAHIARSIFGKQDSRVLLLSATPFKAYAGDSPWESGEAHYKEFRKVLEFLFDGDDQALLTYEGHREALFKQLLDLGSDSGDIDSSDRDAAQAILRRVMCRTERLAVSEDFNAMTVDKWHDAPLPVSKADIQSFVATDAVVQHLNTTEESANRQLRAPVEFCKSAPFPLSFLDDYKLKHELRAKKSSPAVRRKLRETANAWIDHDRVDQYALNLDGSDSDAIHAKLGRILDEVLERSGEQLLWVPPSLPCYPLEGAFSDSSGFSKTLIFSAWLMVPRMLSSLISYEVERRTIGSEASKDTQEEHRRKYFHSKNEKRHPIPQLVFSQKRAEGRETTSNMSNFALLFPSHALAEAFDPKDALLRNHPLGKIRQSVADRIRKLIERADLHRFGSSSGEPDRWYWAAPLLLDRSRPSLHDDVDHWLSEIYATEFSFFFNPDRDGNASKGELTSRDKHFEELQRCFASPSAAGLGRIPSDLPEVLADIAIASPAVSALRSVPARFGLDHYQRSLFAFDVANEFISLFNKPEAIATVRLATQRATYWRRVLQYCADGCLQAVLEEFVHMLSADCSPWEEMLERIADSMNLGTASIKVDDLDSFLRDQRKNMRCHYAVDLGNQRIETEGGRHRIKGIRQNFNSPFRPFVLATTSIGQEGLDFHTYCRKIVHWNLPSNPIDLEQREGRINRFKGLVIRQQVARKYAHHLNEAALDGQSAWDALFQVAAAHERTGQGKCELVPFWHVEASKPDDYRIERIIPFYPFSRDRAKLNTLLKTLAVYRLAFGQPRQAELVDHLLTNVPESRIDEIRDRLMIDLSPIGYLS